MRGYRYRLRIAFLISLLLTTLPGAVAAEEKSITLVAESNWYPYSGVENGAPSGMAVDLVRAAFAAAGQPLTLISRPYARCLEEVESGLHAGCFDTIREPATEARFLFHGAPLFSARILIIAPADSTAEGLGPLDLEGEQVAVTNGYTYGEPFQSSPRIRKEVASSDLAILRLVALKRMPYGVIYEQVMAHLVDEHAEELAGKVRPIGVLTLPDLYVSFSRTHADTPRAIAALDKGLALIRADGTYQEIEQRWLARFNLAANQ